MPKLFEKGQPELKSYLQQWLLSDRYYTRLFALNVIDAAFVKAANAEFLKSCVSPLAGQSDEIGKKAGEIMSRLCVLEEEKKKKKRERRRRKARSLPYETPQTEHCASEIAGA